MIQNATKNIQCRSSFGFLFVRWLLFEWGARGIVELRSTYAFWHIQVWIENETEKPSSKDVTRTGLPQINQMKINFNRQRHSHLIAVVLYRQTLARNSKSMTFQTSFCLFNTHFSFRVAKRRCFSISFHPFHTHAHTTVSLTVNIGQFQSSATSSTAYHMFSFTFFFFFEKNALGFHLVFDFSAASLTYPGTEK